MNNTAKRSLIIFGEALIDDFPEQKIVGGAPFNVARVTASFGCAPLLISRIGTDSNAQLVREEMQRFGLDQRGLQTDTTHPTGRVQVHIDANGHRFEIMPDQAYDHIALDAAEQACADFLMQHTLHTAPLMYFGTLAQRQKTSHDTLMQLLAGSAGINYLDLNLRDGQYTLKEINTSLVHADILKVNEDEMQILTNAFHPDLGYLDCDLTRSDNLNLYLDALQHLLSQFRLSAIIVTLGAHGYVYLNDAGIQLNGFLAHPEPIQVVDTVGCGDAFSSVFLAGMINAWPLALTLQRAHAFAGSVCTIRGAVSNERDFYLDWQNTWRLSGTGAALIGAVK